MISWNDIVRLLKKDLHDPKTKGVVPVSVEELIYYARKGSITPENLMGIEERLPLPDGLLLPHVGNRITQYFESRHLTTLVENVVPFFDLENRNQSLQSATSHARHEAFFDYCLSWGLFLQPEDVALMIESAAFRPHPRHYVLGLEDVEEGGLELADRIRRGNTLDHDRKILDMILYNASQRHGALLGISKEAETDLGKGKVNGHHYFNGKRPLPFSYVTGIWMIGPKERMELQNKTL